VNSPVVVHYEKQTLGIMEKQDVSLARRPPSRAAYQRESANSPYLPLHLNLM
jgi:hypothetical protein